MVVQFRSRERKRDKLAHHAGTLLVAGGVVVTALFGMTLAVSFKTNGTRPGHGQRGHSAERVHGNGGLDLRQDESSSGSNYTRTQSQSGTTAEKPVTPHNQYPYNSSLGRYGHYNGMGSWRGDSGSHMRGTTQDASGCDAPGCRDGGGGDGGGGGG